MPGTERQRCPICSSQTEHVGEKRGQFSPDPYRLRRCRNCGFGFVANPCEDYARIYDEAYYGGHGADPAVAYLDELEHPGETIRRYEWAGIERAVGSLVDLERARWLD